MNDWYKTFRDPFVYLPCTKYHCCLLRAELLISLMLHLIFRGHEFDDDDDDDDDDDGHKSLRLLSHKCKTLCFWVPAELLQVIGVKIVTTS